MSKSIQKCSFFPKCTGCSSWDVSYEEQKISKILHLESLLKEKELSFAGKTGFISCGTSGLRSRTDFTLQWDGKQHIIGFYDSEKSLIEIDLCLQMSSELQPVFTEFRAFNFSYAGTPVKKGSVRLRVGPGGAKGCWLDFSNQDIKGLLDDGVLLKQLLKAGYVVEMGQKRKGPVLQNGQIKFTELNPGTWFKTTATDGRVLSLFSQISGFTQPSWTTAEELAKTACGWLEGTRLLEFGPGIGQFTLAFLSAGFRVDACEIDATALDCLKQSADVHGLSEKLRTFAGDYHRRPAPEKNYDAVFVNPARSGLRNFSRELLEISAPVLVYVSCFPETFAEDAAVLNEKYEITGLKIVDQFPQTKHYEVCAQFKLRNKF